MPTPSEPHAHEEYTLPTAEVLLAGTLALMTGPVQACCVTHRDAMVKKIVINLATLSADPLLSPGFKTLLWSLRGRWLDQPKADALTPLPSTEPHLWHASPEALQ